MKKTFITLVLACISAVSVCAQILRTEELEKYAKEKYGDSWVEAADALQAQLTLDKNKAITYVEVIEAEGRSKDQLYVSLNYWFMATFNDENSIIQLNDRSLGTIIAQGYMSDIAVHDGTANTYKVSIKPIIKCDIKDKKVRVTYTIPYYSVLRLCGAGWLGAIGGTHPTVMNENWTLDTCYPFAAKDSHKQTSCKALVMSHAYSNVVMDKIGECIANGLVGNEDDNW